MVTTLGSLTCETMMYTFPCWPSLAPQPLDKLQIHDLTVIGVIYRLAFDLTGHGVRSRSRRRWGQSDAGQQRSQVTWSRFGQVT